ncbi:MAG: aspartate-semialdehyde dehydrogenase [Nitrospira sp.]|nr:aspartate-semialdehyde dehydrogenase [bacterium]MBL7048083.1 aspartate-semialdehyde dehydrogenase [Nitrospira sp.]
MLKKKDKYVVAVVGATGAVGKEMIKTLEEREFPVKNIRLFASERSIGKTLDFMGHHQKVEVLTDKVFDGIDIALFSAGGDRSLQFAPAAAKAGCIVIDNSSAWRMDPEVPLVVPEVNPDDLEWHKGIIANPNCSTIQMVVVLKPIYDAVGIKRVVVTTFQSVSGTGMKAIEELMKQTRDLLSFQDIKTEVYPHQIAFNCLPHIDSFMEDGYTKEEHKMVNETRKILGDDAVQLTATTVRVPVFRGHSESLNIETGKKILADELRALLTVAPGIKVFDAPAKNIYPLQTDCSGMDDVYVGRIREDNSIANGINMWITADNLRKGAALNAVQIAEELIKRAK